MLIAIWHLLKLSPIHLLRFFLRRLIGEMPFGVILKRQNFLFGTGKNLDRSVFLIEKQPRQVLRQMFRFDEIVVVVIDD